MANDHAGHGRFWTYGVKLKVASEKLSPSTWESVKIMKGCQELSNSHVGCTVHPMVFNSTVNKMPVFQIQEQTDFSFFSIQLATPLVYRYKRVATPSKVVTWLRTSHRLSRALCTIAWYSEAEWSEITPPLRIVKCAGCLAPAVPITQAGWCFNQLDILKPLRSIEVTFAYLR